MYPSWDPRVLVPGVCLGSGYVSPHASKVDHAGQEGHGAAGQTILCDMRNPRNTAIVLVAICQPL